MTAGVLKYTLVVRDEEGAARALLAGQEVPEWASDLVHADDLEGGDSGYSGMKVAELKAEIGKRNEGREDDAKVSDAGKRDELIAALEADDAAHAGN